MLQYHFNWKTISVAAGMTVWNFYFQIFEKAVGKKETILFLTHLLRYLKTPLRLVWDRLPAHRSRLVGEFLHSVKGQIAIEYLPPYAPELNPVEYLWGTGSTIHCPTYVPRTYGNSAKARDEPCVDFAADRVSLRPSGNNIPCRSTELYYANISRIALPPDGFDRLTHDLRRPA